MKHTCCKIDCPNVGRWQVNIKLWASPYHKLTGWPITMTLGKMFVCDDHKASLTAQDFLSDAGKAQIAAEIEQRGKAAPDFNTAELACTRAP